MSLPPVWQLDDLFSGMDDPRLQTLFTSVETQVTKLVEREKGSLHKRNAQEVATILEEAELIAQTIDKPLVYATLLLATNQANSEFQAFFNRTQEKVTRISQQLLFIELEIGALDQAHIDHLLTSDVLSRYKHYLELIKKQAPHRLPEAEERLCIDLVRTGSRAVFQLYEQEWAKKRFGKQQEELIPLLNILHGSDSLARKKAAATISAGFREERDRMASIYNAIILQKEVTDRYRHFSEPEDERHLSNETTQPAVDALVKAIEDEYSLFQKYYRWKQKRLGHRLKDYDRYAPIEKTKQKPIPFDEAKEIILRAFRQFSPRFAEVAQLFFQRQWIHARPMPGKRGGAFCLYGTPDTHPYILLSYHGEMNDVLTLAHELGHGVHAMLSRPNGFFQCSTPLTTAETASVFAEMLVFRALKSQLTNKKERESLLAEKIEEVFGSVFRQTALYRFERRAHKEAREKGGLSADRYAEIWREEQSALFGKSIECTKDYGEWWMYIVHFFDSPFYVYAYAYGELLTWVLYELSLESPKDFPERYLALLEKGGSVAPSQLVAPFDISLQTPETWKRGLRVVESLVKELVEG